MSRKRSTLPKEFEEQKRLHHWILDAKSCTPIPSRAQKTQDAQAFCLILRDVVGLLIPEPLQDIDPHLSFRVSLFDLGTRQFFGNTWCSEPGRLQGTKGRARCRIIRSHETLDSKVLLPGLGVRIVHLSVMFDTFILLRQKTCTCPRLKCTRKSYVEHTKYNVCTLFDIRWDHTKMFHRNVGATDHIHLLRGDPELTILGLSHECGTATCCNNIFTLLTIFNNNLFRCIQNVHSTTLDRI